MSYEVFQRAVADFVAAPLKCVQLRDGALRLDAYDLTRREHDRLLAMVRHIGMSQNCTLYRANRLTPLARSLPKTCIALGRHLLAELEFFWASAPQAELQFKHESERFGRFLLARLGSGELGDVISRELVEGELAALGIQFGSDFHP